MGCAESFVKYTLIFTNIVFALAGLALLGLGVYFELRRDPVVNITVLNVFMASIAVVGGLLFLIAFYGCCGAITESNCMLVAYSYFMIILMIAKITLAVLIFEKMDDFLAEIGRWLDETFERDQNGFHVIEKAFKCCGPQGVHSYLLQRKPVPNSCYAQLRHNIAKLFFGGCNTPVNVFIRFWGQAIGIFVIVIADAELMAVGSGLYLAKRV